MWQSGRKREGRERGGGEWGGAVLLRVRHNAIMTLLLVVSKIRFYGEVGAEWAHLALLKSSTFTPVVVLVGLMEEQACEQGQTARNLGKRTPTSQLIGHFIMGQLVVCCTI
jgi:hypothetical protein